MSDYSADMEQPVVHQLFELARMTAEVAEHLARGTGIAAVSLESQVGLFRESGSRVLGQMVDRRRSLILKRASACSRNWSLRRIRRIKSRLHNSARNSSTFLTEAVSPDSRSCPRVAVRIAAALTPFTRRRASARKHLKKTAISKHANVLLMPMRCRLPPPRKPSKPARRGPVPGSDVG
jgi:hypothetical protein